MVANENDNPIAREEDERRFRLAYSRFWLARMKLNTLNRIEDLRESLGKLTDETQGTLDAIRSPSDKQPVTAARLRAQIDDMQDMGEELDEERAYMEHLEFLDADELVEANLDVDGTCQAQGCGRKSFSGTRWCFDHLCKWDDSTDSDR